MLTFLAWKPKHEHNQKELKDQLNSTLVTLPGGTPALC